MQGSWLKRNVILCISQIKTNLQNRNFILAWGVNLRFVSFLGLGLGPGRAFGRARCLPRAGGAKQDKGHLAVTP